MTSCTNTPTYMRLPALVGLMIAASPPALSQPHELLVQYELPPVMFGPSRADPSCPRGYRRSSTTSKLTVFDNREVVYEQWEHTFCDGDDAHIPSVFDEFEWASANKSVFQYVLSVEEFADLKGLLARPAVKAIDAYYLPDIVGVGSFKIIINRPSCVQHIDVLGLLPGWSSSLEHLICRAKEMGRIASKSDAPPDWCEHIKPLPSQVVPSYWGEPPGMPQLLPDIGPIPPQCPSGIL